MTTTNRPDAPRLYSVSATKKKAVLGFLLDALKVCGCTIVYEPPPNVAPYRIVFDTPEGERMGIVAYAFYANSRVTRNRPKDEHRFQVKYGSKDNKLHPIWQDPYGLYTTLFLGVDPEAGLFVGADPVLHNPTKFFISVEFKRTHVLEITKNHWFAWERTRRAGARGQMDEPVEILVGGTREAFLRYVRFEREAIAEDQGHRQMLAEHAFAGTLPVLGSGLQLPLDEPRLHALSREFQLGTDEILDLISEARRLKMAVRGWVAELHLVRKLKQVRDVQECQRVDAEGSPDIVLRFADSAPISIECKNVLRQRAADGTPRLDFQRTRASIADPCSRYYRATDFDVVAACLHAVTETWEYRFSLTADLIKHTRCSGRIASNLRVDASWTDIEALPGILRVAASRKEA